jgi:hypothetical protein
MENHSGAARVRRNSALILLFVLGVLAPAGLLRPQGRKIQNTVNLPAAAHKKGQVAGFYVDPLSGNRVYRLSDSNLCPMGGSHVFSYTNQFSPKGNMVLECGMGRRTPAIHPLYDSEFKLLNEDVLDAARAPGPGDSFHDIQWSQEREVLYARTGGMIVELDPFARTTRVVLNFIDHIHAVRAWDETPVRISGIRDLSVGPGDRLMVHLQCRRMDRGCPENWQIIGVGVYDPATKQTAALYVPVEKDLAPEGFGEGQWSQNPKGRLTLAYNEAPNFSYTANLKSRVQYEDNHGSRGYFCGSNGRCYKVNMKNDTIPGHKTGPIGCKGLDGNPRVPWQPEYALYDDETGKRELIFGCDFPPETVVQHITRSLGALDVFGFSTVRNTFATGVGQFSALDDAILRATVTYVGDQPAGVNVTSVAQHRSASGGYAKSLGRECGYWATPRPVSDATGTRVLFDSTMSNPSWPAREGGKVKTDCRTDVFVGVYAPAAR